MTATNKKDQAIVLSKTTIKTLIDAIDKYVRSKYPTDKIIYPNWKIGITNAPDRRFDEMCKTFKVSNLTYWNCWNALSIKIS